MMHVLYFKDLSARPGYDVTSEPLLLGLPHSIIVTGHQNKPNRVFRPNNGFKELYFKIVRLKSNKNSVFD